MGTATNEFVNTIHATGRGSDCFGNCEVCKKSASEMFVGIRHRVFGHESGMRYLSAPSGGTYGHAECVRASYPGAFDKHSLQRVGQLIVAPEKIDHDATGEA